MKKLGIKKMTLTRETLRKLTDDQVREAEGGFVAREDIPWTSDSVKICCA